MNQEGLYKDRLPLAAAQSYLMLHPSSLPLSHRLLMAMSLRSRTTETGPNEAVAGDVWFTNAPPA